MAWFYKVILILEFFTFCMVSYHGQVSAADWYVDNAVAASGNGQSWATAWKEFSNIVWGNSGVKAGDSLYISGGATSKTYTATLTVGASGTPGNPITIRVGQEAGHNGEVIFDFDALGDTATGAGIGVSNRAYITIDGSVGTARKLTIKNLRNTSSRTEAVAVYANTTTNIIVQNINVDNCNNGVRIAYGTGHNINNNRFTGMRGDGAVSLLASTGTWDANLVHHNYIGIAWNPVPTGNGGPDGVQIGHGCSVYDNTIRVDEVVYATSNQHPDSIQAVGNYHKIYNNDFINIGDSGYNGSGNYFETHPHDIWIFNNTFRIITAIDPYPEFIRFYFCGQSLTNFKVFNNTFIDNPWTTVSIDCTTYTWGNTTASGIEIKNNIWYNAGTASNRPALYIAGGYFTDSSFDINNNIYYGGAYISYFGTAYTAANWLSSHEPNSRTSQPLFVSYSPNNINNDLRLSPSDTAAKDHGLNLSSYFTTDKDGNSRTATWDIGAYEYVAGNVVKPTAPAGLTVR